MELAPESTTISTGIRFWAVIVLQTQHLINRTKIWRIKLEPAKNGAMKQCLELQSRRVEARRESFKAANALHFQTQEIEQAVLVGLSSVWQLALPTLPLSPKGIS